MHWASQCRFKQTICYGCGKQGHITVACKTKHSNVRHHQQDGKQPPREQQPKVQYQHNNNSDHVFQYTDSSMPPMRVDLTVNGAPLCMVVDTEASVSIINENTYHSTWSAVKQLPKQPTDTHLFTYSRERIDVLGTIAVTVCYKQQTKHLSLVVVPTEGPALFGRDWLKPIVTDWKQLNHVYSIRHRALQDVLNQYAGLFKEQMGTL